MPSYAVIWAQDPSRVCAGQLSVLHHGLRLDGTDRSGEAAAVEVQSAEIVAVEVGRSREDRIDGRSSVIVRRARGDRVVIASAVGLGLTHEIADELARVAQIGG